MKQNQSFLAVTVYSMHATDLQFSIMQKAGFLMMGLVLWVGQCVDNDYIGKRSISIVEQVNP